MQSESARPSSVDLLESFNLPDANEPPLYRIDLDLQPRFRHRQICEEFAGEISDLISLFDDILALTPSPRILKRIAKFALRRVYSKEETEEIRGISEKSGVELYLVVAFNTFLDLFSGCVSGGVKVASSNGKSKMVHFRGLDWDMEQLRKIIIRVEYVRGGAVVARAVSYAGYVGILTGVRKNLSISFNYRARLSSSSSTFAHRIHQLLLLLGHRPSIPSILRRILLSPTTPTLSHLASTFPSIRSSPGYVIFCTPDEVLVIEKDLACATVLTSTEFLAVTNHDQQMESWGDVRWAEVLKKEGLTFVSGIKEIMEESVERKEFVERMWRADSRARPSSDGDDQECGIVSRIEDVKKWLMTEPIVNELTHYSCIMDPSVDGGGIIWVRAHDIDDGN